MQNANSPFAWRVYALPVSIACLTILSGFVAYQPARLYFFGDTWDLLFLFHTRLGWREMWITHNDHFIPLSKAFLYLEYLLFGMNNFPYQAVNILIHAANTVLLYFCAAELSPLVAPRLFGALFFGLSGVHWEVVMWETGQQISLALLFTLLTLLLYGQFFRHRDVRMLAYAWLGGVCACCSMGFGLLVVPLLIAEGVIRGRPQWRRSLAISAVLAVAILLCYAVLLWSHHPHFANAGHIARIGQVVQLIPWTLNGLRDGLLIPSASLFGPLFLGGLSLAAGLFLWRFFLSRQRLCLLLVPVVLVLGPYLLTGAGRLSMGLNTAASSRYQYLPVAGLALLLVWLVGGVIEIAARRDTMLLFPLGLVALLTLPVHAISGYAYVRQHSPRFLWGEQARRFVDLAIYQRARQPSPAGMACVSPELNLPASIYPFAFPLFRVLPMYAADGVIRDECTVSLRSALETPEIEQDNLLKGSATGVDPGKWRSYAAAKGSAGIPGSETAHVVRIELPQSGSAYSLDVPCAGTFHPYSFVASVQLVSGEPNAHLRILSKDRAGNILNVVHSPPISSAQFETIVVSAYPEPGADTVGVDFANTGASGGPVALAVKKAVLLQHPVYVPVGDLPVPR